MVDQDGDQPRATGDRVMGDQSAAERVKEHGEHGNIALCSNGWVKPRLVDRPEDAAKVEAVLHHLQERALEEMGDLFAQLRRSAVEPTKIAPSDLAGYVLVKRCDLVPLLISVYGPDELNKRLRDLIYAYPRQGDD